MKYIDGYVNLDNEKMIKDPNPKKIKYGMNESFWFMINDEEYFYKECLELEEAYMEMFASIIAKCVDIKTVKYDIAIFHNHIGVVSKNYNEKHLKEKALQEIINNFYKKVIEKNKEYNYQLKDLYNLEMIWDALRYQYQDNEIVLKLMKDIIDSFILQFLTGNRDLNLSNLVIIEDDIPYLAPNHDYSIQDINNYSELNYALEVEPKSKESILDNFLNTSSDYYINYFKEKIMAMPKIETIFLRVELKAKKKIPTNIKLRYMRWYEANLNALLEKIEYRLNEPKR